MIDEINFEDFQFEVIDISVSGTPDMHVTKNGITFTRKLLEAMDYPQYVQAMINVEKKMFALKKCKAENDRAICFSKSKEEQKKALQISNSTIRLMLRDIMQNNWKEEYRYHMTGKWFAEAKAMVFDLNSAKELPPFSVHKRLDKQY